MTNQDITDILITLIGAWLFYRSRKRVFDRRNAFGQEVFDSYRHKLTARLIDLILGFFATVVMLTGIIFLAIEHQNSWGWIVLLPLAWLFIVGYIPSTRQQCRK